MKDFAQNRSTLYYIITKLIFNKSKKKINIPNGPSQTKTTKKNIYKKKPNSKHSSE